MIGTGGRGTGCSLLLQDRQAHKLFSKYEIVNDTIHYVYVSGDKFFVAIVTKKTKITDTIISDMYTAKK